MILSLCGTEAAFAKYGGDQGSGGGGSGSGGPSAIGQTQTRRSSERFNILDFIRSQQSAVNGQNAKYGRGSGGSGPYPDLVLSYFQDSGTVIRDSQTLGKDSRSGGRVQFLLDDLCTKGNRKMLLNIDLGAEGYLSQTTGFVVDSSSSQVSHSYSETGGALLLRPFGRSSQDTGLLAKVGYMNLNETGLWANNQTQVSLYSTYLGAEAKIYLMNFLGVKAEYQNALESTSDTLRGKWKMQRFIYGAFLEIYLLNLEAHLISSEMTLTPTASGVAVKETYSGVGFSGTLYF